VVQPEDLPATFVSFDEGAQTTRDAGPGARADLSRFGRQGGWKARYRQGDRAITTGLLVVESRVDLFTSEKGARQELSAYETEFKSAEEQGDTLPADVDPIGDEAQAVTLVQGTGDGAPRFHTVAWRFRNAVGAVTVQGTGGDFTVDQAVDLAREQQSRLRSAARP